ncbi:YHS domain-containing protein [Candidatus Marsarchaeota archaeon]|nr:YHS domain-containing protein [Candidatus Marsarchaeota archaeon]
MKDPVCNMDVEGNSKYKSSYKGAVYYFCSESCKKKFDSTPEKYTSG